MHLHRDSKANAYRTDDMCDTHERIINGHTEIVHRKPIAAQDDKVADCISVEFHVPSDAVRYDDVLIRRHPEPVAEGRALHSTEPQVSQEQLDSLRLTNQERAAQMHTKHIRAEAPHVEL